MTPWRTRSLPSRSIALWTAVARWRAPGCRYPSSTSFVMTAKDATGRSKWTTPPPMRHPPMSPAACFSRHCRKRLSRSGTFRTGYAKVCDQTSLVRKTRRKDWISGANGAVLRSLWRARRALRSCPAGVIAVVGLRWCGIAAKSNGGSHGRISKEARACREVASLRQGN
jgi:hypothetical protein